MRRILVIRLSSLGDVVLTLPVFKRLRADHPDAHIAVLVKDVFADVLKGESAINEVITFTKEDSLYSLIQKVRRARFDAVLDLHANIRSRIISAFSGAPRVVRYKKAALARRLFVGWRIKSDDLKKHTLDRYMDALDLLLPSREKAGMRDGVDRHNNPSPLSSPLKGEDVKKILIIQTAFLGDAVLTTPLLGALQKQFPQAKLSVLCTPEIVEVFERHPAVSEVILFDKRGQERTLTAKWALVKRLKTSHFDLAIIPHRSLTSALLARLAGISRRIGFSASQGRWFLTDVVPFQWGVHDVDRNLALMNVFGVQNPSGELWLKADPDTAKTIAAKLQSSGITAGDKIVGINAGSVWATKRWLPEGFATVADRVIRDLGAKVVFIGGPKDAETMDRVLSLMKEKAVNWVGKTSLKELVAVIARCQAFLTNDSGPLHIAVASQVPTVAIFGPTTKELGFFPYGPGHRVIEKDLPCRPCGLHGADKCPLEHFQCMKLITPDEVFTAVKAQLT